MGWHRQKSRQKVFQISHCEAHTFIVSSLPAIFLSIFARSGFNALNFLNFFSQMVSLMNVVRFAITKMYKRKFWPTYRNSIFSHCFSESTRLIFQNNFELNLLKLCSTHDHRVCFVTVCFVFTWGTNKRAMFANPIPIIWTFSYYTLTERWTQLL